MIIFELSPSPAEHIIVQHTDGPLGNAGHLDISVGEDGAQCTATLSPARVDDLIAVIQRWRR